MVSGYVRTKSYSIANMEEREAKIREAAEKEVARILSWPRRLVFNWVLFHARRGENMSHNNEREIVREGGSEGGKERERDRERERFCLNLNLVECFSLVCKGSVTERT